MLVKKLLKENLSISQLVGYSVASLVGLSIMLLSLQLYFDVRPLFSSNDSFLKKDFLVVSKKVSLLKTIGTSSTRFKESEIESLRQQPFVSKLACFTPSTFHVELSTDGTFQGVDFATYLFFEAIPDEFIDVTSADWGWEEGSNFIPIVIPRDYLNLYNFGFAQSQGLPQLSETLIGKVGLSVRVAGKGRSKYFNARIVGFSNKINTILVPQTFLEWANSTFGSSEELNISRLLVEVKNPTDPAIAEYIAANDYELNSDELDSGKAAYFLNLLVGIVISIGIVITLLAVGLLMLSMSLLIHKNKSKLENLMLIGYSPNAIAAPYQRLALMVTTLVFVAAIALVVAAKLSYTPALTAIGLKPAVSWAYAGIGLGILVIICVANYLWIKSRINAVFKPQ